MKLLHLQYYDWFACITAWLPFWLPFLYPYWLVGAFGTSLWRSSLLIVVGAAGLLLICWRAVTMSSNWRNLAAWQVAAASLALVMLVSSLLSGHVGQSLFGLYGDFQGALLQIASLVVGYIGSKYCKHMLSIDRLAMVLAIACGASILVDSGYLVENIRLSGLILHDTGMGLWAALGLGLHAAVLAGSGKHRPLRPWITYAGAAVCLLALLLTASRIGLIVSVGVGLLYGIITGQYRRMAVYFLCLTIGTLLMTRMFAPYGRITNQQRVEQGVNYRRQLYSWSLHQSEPTLIGRGSSQVYRILQPADGVQPPADIRKTLQTGYPLWYSHSQWIDTYIMYGLVGLGLYGYLWCMAIWHWLHSHGSPQMRLLIGSLLIVSLADFSVNTPSIELMPIVFLAIFSSLRLEPTLWE